MNNLINTWRESKETFKQQLERNLYELNRGYPPHWKNFLEHIGIVKPKKVVDVGCGVGGLYTLLKKHYPKIEYVGYDYSEHAINTAKQAWLVNNFEVRDYKDIPEGQKDLLLVANALADVLPNGDECISFLLQKQYDHISLLRVRLTEKDSYYNIYNAYDIQTYEYHHNKNNLFNMFKIKGYEYKSYTYSQDIMDILCTKK